MKTSDFDYSLPRELIAQTPVEPRDHSRLLVLHRGKKSLEHRRFFEIIEYLRDGDVMVVNDSRVIPARLRGRRDGDGGRVELLLLRRLPSGSWEALVKPARRLHAADRVRIITDTSLHENPVGLVAEITGEGRGGIRVVSFSDEASVLKAGEVPLPPYINTPLADPERYQTVYARIAGSVAAPTAGLHFTPELLRRIEQKGVRLLPITLHVGLDTFRPVTEDDPRTHVIYQEYGVLSKVVADGLSGAKKERRRIICVGTTTARILEQAAQVSQPGELEPFEDWVSLFILPGHRFRMVDSLITNFHLPRSTLLMMVTAFAGKELIDKAYCEAIAQKYRFYSFGDAMLVL